MGALSMDIVETLEEVLIGPRQRMHSCELVQRFLTGRLTRAHYIAFLTQTWHFVRFTPTHLRIAAARMPEGALRERFLKHAREEMGHDDWALADLEALGVAPAQVIESIPLPETRALIDYQRHTAENLEPMALLGLEYAMEGFTASAGSAALAGLQQSLGLSPAATRFLRRHAELDTVHAVDDAAVIRQHVQTSAQRQAVLENAQTSMLLYAAVYEAICREVR